MKLPESFGTCPKNYLLGTHRVVDPEETLRRSIPLMPPMGITRIANITGLDRVGIPVAIATRPNSRSLAVAQGKGLTLAAAKASGVMEAIEGYHAERITKPLKLGSFEELRYTHSLCEPESLPRVRGSLYHANKRILWVGGRDLLSQVEVWVPYELVHTDFTLPSPMGSGCFIRSSNGLASGNHPLEATSHGLSEAVERDATSLWLAQTKNCRERTRLQLTTVDDSHCCELLQRFDRAGLAVAVWDSTSDIGIPSFVCTIVERDLNTLGHTSAASGMGCHPSREIALLRTLTEAAQSRLTYISGSRDDATKGRYEQSHNLDNLKSILDQVSDGIPVKRYQSVPTFSGTTIDEDLEWMLGRLSQGGFDQVIVVDLTKPEFGIPVVRVLVPGLEGQSEAPDYMPGPRGRAAA